jgi:hypothetical protein
MDFLLDDAALRGPRQAVMGQPAPFALSLPGEANRPFLCAVSEAIQPATALPGGALLPLRNGGILQASLTPSPVFQGFQGVLDSSGRAAPTLFVPPVPPLAGLDLYLAGLTFDPALPAARVVTNWRRVRLRL